MKTAQSKSSQGLPVSRSGLLLFLLAVSSSAAAQDANAKAILGVWRGTSVCVNREAAPACRDEEVIYDFREATPPAAGKLTLKADKIEGGKVENGWFCVGHCQQHGHTAGEGSGGRCVPIFLVGLSGFAHVDVRVDQAGEFEHVGQSESRSR